jgi:outer membrane protein assembly factor BamB
MGRPIEGFLRIAALPQMLFAAAVVLCGNLESNAGQWPQILGPHRNGQADGETLADRWPSAGPATIWQHALGSGLAGAAGADGRVVVFHRQVDQELVESLDAVTGKRIWKTPLPATYVPTYTSDDGPRCVPVVHAGFVYLCGAACDLYCLDAQSGRRVWSRALAEDYRIPESYFGAGSTPLIEGDRLLLNVGGLSGAGMMAFSLSDGKTVWKSSDERASYSSPTACTVAGVRHVIFVTRYHLLSVDPASGRVRWRLPFGKRGPTVNAATPLLLDDSVFVSASYGVGAMLARITPDAAHPTWANDTSMSSQYSTCVHHEGLLYGIDGRQDVGVARLRAVDPQTGEVKWTEEGFGMASLILADGKLVIMKTDGHLVLARPSPEKYQQLASAKIFDATVQALPALSDGMLYVRDTTTLKCLQLAPSGN